MRTAALLIFTSCLSFYAFAQAPYQRTSGKGANEAILGIVEGHDHGSVITGYTKLGGTSDVWLQRQDSAGKEMWSKRFDGGLEDAGNAIIRTSDGGYLVVGYSQVAGKDKEILVLKTDGQGNILWQHLFGRDKDDEALNAMECVRKADTIYAVVGYFQGSYGMADMFFLEIKPDGTVGNSFEYGSPTPEVATSIAFLDSNQFVIAGHGISHTGTSDIFTIHTDSTGAMRYANLFNGGEEDFAYDVAIDQGAGVGGIINIVGAANGFGKVDRDILYFGYRVGQDPGWAKIYGTPGVDDEGFSIQTHGGSGVTFCGYVTDDASKDKDGFMIFTDWGGNIEGSKRFTGSGCGGDDIYFDHTIAYYRRASHNGFPLAGGVTSSYGNGGDDGLITAHSTIWGLNSGCGDATLNINTQDVTIYKDDSTTWIKSQINSITWQNPGNLKVYDAGLVTSDPCEGNTGGGGCNANADLGSDEIASCGGSLKLGVASACGTYLWSTGETTDTIEVSKAGEYWVKVTNSATCSASDTITVNLNGLNINTTIISKGACDRSGAYIFDAIAEADGGKAPFTYEWNTTPVQTNDTATGLAPGTYMVTAIDSTGCTGKKQVVIKEPIEITVVSKKAASCATCKDGSIKVQVNGGASPYTYRWNDTNQQTTAEATGLPKGSYKVTVTDSKDCFASKTFDAGVVGIEDYEEEWRQYISINPQPIRNNLNIGFNGGLPAHLISLYDLTGSKIREIKVENGFTGELSIDMHNQPAGYYLMVISTPDNNWPVRVVKY